MPAANEDPIVATMFAAEFGNHLTGMFLDFKGLSSSTEVSDLKTANNTGKILIKKIPGNHTFSDITLSKGLTTSMELWKWLKLVQDGKMPEARVNGTITVYNEKAEACAKFEFTDAFPSAITGPSLASDSNEIGIEELTITHTGFKRVKV